MNTKEIQDLQLLLKKRLGEDISLCMEELWQRLHPKSSLINDLTSLQGRFIAAKKEFEKGTIDYRSEFERVRNQVHGGLTTLIESLRDADVRKLRSGALFEALEQLSVDADKLSRPVFLVNCNRTDPRKVYKKGARDLKDAPLQFCLVKACPLQRPQSFVERLLLEEVARYDDDPDTSLYFKRLGEDRLDVKSLPVDDDPDDAFASFKRAFKEAFSDYVNSQSGFSKAAFAFALHETGWNADLPGYLELVLEWKANEALQRKTQFLFFLVLYLPQIHLLPDPAEHPIARSLQPLLDKYPGYTIDITGLPPVPRHEVEAWLHSVAQAGVAHNASDVLDAFDDHVRQTAPKRYQRHVYDMQDVEFLQFEVQRFVRKTPS